MSATKTSAANLVQAMKDLSAEWSHTRASWRDTQSDHFARTYLDPLPSQVSRALVAMEEIEALLRKVHADCD